MLFPRLFDNLCCCFSFPVPPISAELWHDASHKLNGDRQDLLLGERPPKAGELFRNPNLANVMQRIAEQGRAGFYQVQSCFIFPFILLS
jgi:gamma-glutamyltranspeptidase/glutathione hydrolase